MQEMLLTIKNLRTSFRIDGNFYGAVDDVDLEIRKNEVFALVGESGCGKSAMALSITKLHNSNYTQISGKVLFEGQNLLDLNEKELNKIRGGRIGMIFQDPLTALNPLMRIGAQIEETLTYHTDLDNTAKKDRAIELLKDVGMTNPNLTYSQLPHELSGGMRQRVMIAIALACKPDLIIADEPTTALDVTIQAQILDLLRILQSEMQSSVILITHDLGVVAETADRVAVMYAGQIVELASVHNLFKNPQHPYTRSLLASIPGMGSVGGERNRLHVIQGLVPTLKHLPRTGCRFSHRTPWIPDHIHEETPSYHEISPDHHVLCTCYKEFSFDGEGF